MTESIRRMAAPGGPRRAAGTALHVLAALLLATAWQMGPAPAVHAGGVGEMEVLKGEATVIRGQREIKVTRRYVLEDKDRVRTSAASKVVIRLYAPLTGSDVVATEATEFQVRELYRVPRSGPFQLIWGALRSRLAGFAQQRPFMQTGTAVIGIKGTDFIVYVKQKEASEFIGVTGLIEARSRSRPEYALEIGKRQWGKIVADEKPNPPIRVPDDVWAQALSEFSFPGEPANRAQGGQ